MFEVVAAGILNPRVKRPVSVMYDDEGTGGWNPGLSGPFSASSQAESTHNFFFYYLSYLYVVLVVRECH